MATLSAEEIAFLAQNANAATRGASEKGFSSTRTHRGYREDATAVAVALAESGGNPQAHNATPPDDSYGLWQINMYGSLGPARRKQFGLSNNSQLFNPAINADAAYQVFTDAGRQFGPWSVYKSGSYLKHMPAALRAVGAPKTPGDYPGSTLPDTVLPTPLQELDKLLPRIAYFVGGALVLLVALALYVGETGHGATQIARAIPGPVGKAAKIVRKVT